MRTNSSHQPLRSPNTRLAEARAVLEAAEGEIGREAIATEASALEIVLGGLLGGGVHEWFDGCERDGGWRPALAVLIDLAWRSIERNAGHVVWVGRRCWPYAHALIRRDAPEPRRDATGPRRDATGPRCDAPGPGTGDRRLLERSVFVDPPGRGERVWAIELALRCAGVAAVVGDGSELCMAETRRLQLAAGASERAAVALLARPGRERGELSAARTRWMVRPCVSQMGETRAGDQAWTVELLRCKGLQPSGSVRRWAVRRDHATGAIGEWTACDVGVAADVVGGPASEARPAHIA